MQRVQLEKVDKSGPFASECKWIVSSDKERLGHKFSFRASAVWKGINIPFFFAVRLRLMQRVQLEQVDTSSPFASECKWIVSSDKERLGHKFSFHASAVWKGINIPFFFAVRLRLMQRVQLEQVDTSGPFASESK
jgi:hypothetical protein